MQVRNKPLTNRSGNPRTDDMQRLRDLLLGKDFQELLELRHQFNTPELHSHKVAEVISEAIHLRGQRDETLAAALSPTIESTLSRSIENDPQRMADALYPVMGPAIRKSINETLSQTFENFNLLMEQSLSPRFLGWRFDAWRTGRSYSEVVLLNTLEYQVEQVFLIHESTGLLLRHAQAPQAISKDPDMVSGMLTAIQDFIADSFSVQDGGTLKRLRLGELTVIVDQGPHAVLAAVIRGNPPGDFSGLLHETQESIHQQMGNTLLNYRGDSEPFARIHPLLEACLITQRQEQKKRAPWLVYSLLAVSLALMAYWAYTTYREHREIRYQEEQQALLAQREVLEKQRQQQLSEQTELAWRKRIARMNAEPGVVVINSEMTESGYRVHGLSDPLARHPETFTEAMHQPGEATVTAKPLQIDYEFQPYISAAPEILLRRATQVLEPPLGISMLVDEGVLRVSGAAEPGWRDRLHDEWQGIPGITALDDQGLKAQISLQAQVEKLAELIQQARYLFVSPDAKIAPNTQHFTQQAADIKKLLRLSGKIDKNVQIIIRGNTDSSGGPKVNEKLALERAERARDTLVGEGVPASVFTIGKSLLNERSVSYAVNFR